MARLHAFTLLIGLTAATGLLHAAEETTSPVSAQLPTIIVTDQAGQPVVSSEATMIQKDRPMVSLKTRRADSAGHIQFNASDSPYAGRPTGLPDGIYQVLVTATGKAPAIAQVTLPSSAPLTVKLNDGQPIEIQVKPANGQALPDDIVPTIYPRQFGAAFAPSLDTPSTPSLMVKKLGNGRFQVNLEETSDPLSLVINDPDYMRGFETALETTSSIKAKSVVIDLPAPGGIDISLDVPTKWRDTVSTQVLLYGVHRLLMVSSNMGMYVPIVDELAQPGSALTTTTIKNLAPGKYIVAVAEKLKSTSAGQKSGAFGDEKPVEVIAGETTSATFTYNRFDPAILKGNFTANVRVKRFAGAPYANQPVELRYRSPEFGHYAISTGTLDAEGQITFSGLAGNFPGSTGYRLHEGGEWGSQIGMFNFVSSETSQIFEITMAPREGDMAPDIELQDVFSTATVKLSDYRGQVVFLDFWATWCGPCQEPMAHNQAIMEKQADAWKNKAVIVAASIDEDTDTVIRHVKQKGWESMKHLWCGPDTFRSKAATTYGVTGIPTCVLIDQQGKIVWKGHPSGFNLEQEVEKLLK